MQLKDKQILVTGGRRGIGLALVELLLDHGARVVAIGRDRDGLRDLERRLDVETVVADLSVPSATTALAATLVRKHPKLDVVINNAAVQREIDLLQPPRSGALTEEIAVNLAAPITLIAALLPQLVTRPEAAIVNIGSALALAPKRAAPIYCATKAALHSFSQALRAQLADTSVRVLEVFPPVVDTDMTGHRAVRKIPPRDVALKTVRAIESNREEIWIGEARLIPPLARLAPSLVRHILDRS